jgi:hypothetical protein
MIRSAPPAPFKTALLTLLIAVVVALFAAGKADARHANWKVFVTIDYTSTGTVTDSECFPDPEQTSPSPVTATTSRELTLRTVKPTTIQMYEAPNGVPATIPVGPPYKAQVTESREPGVTSGGSPSGCFGGGSKQDCDTRSVRSGGYFNPLGGVGHWKGFRFEPEREPSFGNCSTVEAEGKLPDPLQVDIKVSPAKLTGHAPKLVFHRTRRFEASAHDGSRRSSASAKLTYTVKLVHR